MNDCRANEELLATFWEHIEELRRTVLAALFIIFCGFIITLCLYKPLFHLLISPLSHQQMSSTSSILKQTMQHERVINQAEQSLVYSLPTEARPVFISEGAREIQTGLYTLAPGKYIDYERPIAEHKLFILNPLEGFLVIFKICFWLSVAGTSPLWAYRILKFINPGLKPSEKQLIIPFMLISLCALGGGILFAYTLTLPLANHYFEGFNSDLGINHWALAHYVDYTIILLLGHAIAFELGVILFFMVHLKALSMKGMAAKRRYVIVGAFILGALLTPPDIITQFLLAVPLIGIYELAILYGKMRSKFTA